MSVKNKQTNKIFYNKYKIMSHFRKKNKKNKTQNKQANKQKRVKLDVRKDFFTERVDGQAGIGIGCSRKWWGPHSWRYLKTCRHGTKGCSLVMGFDG